MSQTTSQASLCQGDVQSDQNYQQGLQDCMLSQSEMCLSHRLTGSRSSLVGSEGFASPADSQASLNSSRTSLSCASQSCLLNQEQTQGLLSKAQSRSQANLNHGLSRGILSRIRSLNRVQSQACLLNGTSAINCERANAVATMNPIISKSREKLYGLRSLSKSQGVLDIYRSLECLKRRRKSYQRARTEDMLPIFKQLDAELASSRLTSSISDDRLVVDVKSEIDLTPDKIERKIDQNVPTVSSTDAELSSGFGSDDWNRTCVKLNNDSQRVAKNAEAQTPKKFTSESEENLDSLKSVESDTLTEDSDEMPLCHNAAAVNANKRPCERQHSDVSSRSNNSDDKEDRSTESENDEPKYTVAQLVSAFNKHQEVASRTSLRAIMSERRINEMTFPTGTKALRLFIPDINITENKIVRRKTSYKPRKNWEELRKRSEKNEGVLKSLDNDSGNEDDDNEDETRDSTKDDPAKDERDTCARNTKESVIDVSPELITQEEDTNLLLDHWSLLQSEENNGQSIFVDNASTQNSLDTTIDEKYKQCVKGAMSGKMETHEDKNEEKYPKALEVQPRISIRQKERLPNYIYPDITVAAKDDNRETKKIVAATNGKSGPRISKIERAKPSFGADSANVNLKDILQRVDNSQNTSKENLENLRKRTSIAKIILNDNLVHDNQDLGLGGCKTNSRAKSEPFSNDGQSEDRVKLVVPPSFIRSSSLSSDSSCPTPSSVQSDMNVSWEDIQAATGSSTSLEKEDVCKIAKKNDVQRTCSEGRNRQCAENRKVWGRICTGSYTRAMEKFNGKNIDAAKKSLGSTILTQQMEKTRRKSSPSMP